jgi:hypothetical protein
MEELKYKIGFETEPVKADDLVDPSVISTLVDLNKQIEEYKLELKTLQALEEIQNGLTKEQADQQQKLKIELKQVQDAYSRVSREIQNNAKAANDNKNTYQGLVNENKRLMDAMRNLPLDDTTGELERLQKQYNSNNDTLKKFDERLGNHQRNVGNYTSALDGTAAILSKLPGPIANTNKAVEVFNATLKANTLGLVIAGVTALIAILSKLEPVQKLINHLLMVFGEAFTFVTNALSTLIDGQERNIRSLKEQIALNKQLKAAEEAVAISRGQTPEALANIENEIAKIDLALSKGNLTEQQRNDLLSQRTKLENGLVEVKRNQLLTDKNLLATQLEKVRGTEEEQEVRNQIADNQAALTALSTEGILKEADANNKLNDDRLKAQEEQKKRAEDAEKLREKKLEEERKAIESLAAARQGVDQKMFDNLDKMREGEIDLAIDLIPTLDMRSSTLAAELFNETLKEQTIARLEEEGKFAVAMEEQKQWRIQALTQMFIDDGVNEYQASLDAKLQADLEYEDQLRQSNERTEQFKRDQTTKTLDLIQFAATAAISIGKNIFGESKALAVAQAIIDSLGAAVGVMRDTKGPLWVRLTNAAVILSAGYANVKKILSTKPGSGAAGGTSAASAVQPPSPFALGFQNEGMVMPQRFGMQSPFATGMASSVGDRFMNRGEINIQANVDRRGLAIAVREGERSIRTQQFDYR